MKMQVLADFVTEYTIPNNKSVDTDNSIIKQAMTPEPNQRLAWVLHIDRASNTQGSRASLILTNFEGVVTEYVFQFNFKASNNQAEYKALLADLKIAREFKIDNLKVFTDLQLIAG